MLMTKCLIRRICLTLADKFSVQMEDEQREALSLWLAEQKRCAEHHSENRQITVPTGRRC